MGIIYWFRHWREVLDNDYEKRYEEAREEDRIEGEKK